MERRLRLRPLDLPSAVRVRTDRDEFPVMVWLGGGRQPTRVAAVRESWRIDDEWWRDPLSRIYHDVVLENGKVVTLYQDLIEGTWWMQ
jgi:hypothetical protein